MRHLELVSSKTGGARDVGASGHLASTTTNGESDMTVAGLPATPVSYLEEAAYARYWRAVGSWLAASEAGDWNESRRLCADASRLRKHYEQLRGAA